MILIGTLLSSCAKDQSSNIYGVVSHHEVKIPFAKVYVKYGTNLWPGADVTLYDVMVEADTNANYSLDNLSKGWNYIYATGYDSGFSDSVFGGIPFEIKKKKSNLEINVPVTE